MAHDDGRDIYGKHLPEQAKVAHNLSTLLKCSNVTPFRGRNAMGYACAYCANTYRDPKDLRIHTHTDHVKHRLAYNAGKDTYNFVAFLDISDLKCTICGNNYNGINNIQDHLTEIHNLKYYTDINEYLQPFKLTLDDRLQCSLCTEWFDNFKSLVQHMNTHFSNFICPSCGVGFINRHRLKQHELTHVKTKKLFKCSRCEEVFDVESKRKSHITTVHRGLAGENQCQICKSRFKNYYQKSLHMIEVHKSEANKCHLCERSFTLKSTLSQHHRRDHMKERAYECEVCHLRFFIRKRMLEHMVVHTGRKDYSCDVCGKSFARQKNLRVHMKTHDC